MVQRWSEDGGVTWSLPLRTDIWGYPPHLLKLRDGRVLCTYGYRRDPMGVRAVLSHDGGESWDTDNHGRAAVRRRNGQPAQSQPRRRPGRRRLPDIYRAPRRRRLHRLLHHAVRRRNPLRRDDLVRP